MKKIFEVVKVFDIEPFVAGDGDLFRFRLEITQEVGAKIYIGKVYRQEFYRLQPLFPQSGGEPPDWKNDAQIFVIDEMFDAKLLQGNSVEDIVIKFQAALTNIFG